MHYVDTSAFLKLLVREEHSAAMRSFVRKHNSELCSSDLLRVEAIRALRRSAPDELGAARAAVRGLVLLAIDDEVVARAEMLEPPELRSLDALHLAAAMTWGSELRSIVTYDERLAAAAARRR